MAVNRFTYEIGNITAQDDPGILHPSGTSEVLSTIIPSMTAKQMTKVNQNLSTLD